jgi:hypothetical protein
MNYGAGYAIIHFLNHHLMMVLMILVFGDLTKNHRETSL